MPTATLATEIASSLPFGDLGLAGIVTLTVLALLTGRIVPRRQHEDTIAERDQWRAAHEKSEEARHILTQQLDHALTFTKTVEHVLRSLPTTPDRRDTPP